MAYELLLGASLLVLWLVLIKLESCFFIMADLLAGHNNSDNYVYVSLLRADLLADSLLQYTELL